MSESPISPPRPRRSLRLAACLLVLGCAAPGDEEPEIRSGTDASESTAGTFTVGGDRLAYDTQGDGCAVVLVAGGSGMDRLQWQDIAAPLAAGHRVVRYDPRGVGASDLPSAPYSDEEDLDLLLDHLEIEQAILAGVSSAGGLVLGYAVEHPERVLAVVAAAPFVTGFPFAPDMQERIARMGRAAQEGREPYLDAMLDDPHFLPAPTRTAIREAARENMGANYDRSRNVDFSLSRTLDPPLIERLDEVAAPVLLVAGELDHPEVHRRQSFLDERLPASRMEVIADAGHNPQLENPSALLDVITPFLAERCDG